jgi:hypothetical protein
MPKAVGVYRLTVFSVFLRGLLDDPNEPESDANRCACHSSNRRNDAAHDQIRWVVRQRRAVNHERSSDYEESDGDF